MAILSARVRRAGSRHGVAAGLALVCALVGCSSREHANPLDPANRETAGRPSGFAAVALSGQVLLSWNATNGLGTQVFRKSDLDPDFSALTPVLPPAQTLVTDSNAPNDITYHYRLYFVTPKGLSALPATADATPSRVVAYAADADLGALVRLSADGREVATVQPGFGQPGYLALDRARDLVWVTDFFDGRVYVYNPTLGSRVNASGFFSPNVLAIDPLDGSAWVTDYTSGDARHLLLSGGPGTPASISLLDGPLGIDIDPGTRVLWICEKLGDRVRQFSADGTALGAISFPAPSRVAVDSANGEAWITSFEKARLLHVAADRTVLHTVTALRGPVGVAVDPRRGRIWVADPVAGQVVAFRRDGTEELRVGGLTGARDLAVELASGEAWVAMNGTIARVSPTGTVLTTTRGLSAPVAVGLDRVAGP